MTGYEGRFRLFAMLLSALAGFVDAVGFLLTGGLFVSFMSGNSTRVAVASAAGTGIAMLGAGLIAMFLAGVIAGALLAAVKPARRKCLVLGFSTIVTCAAAALASSGLLVPAAMLLALSMGSINNVFLRDGEVSIGVTYMTGTLVKAGQRIAGALRGEGPSDWLPYLLLWASLIGGAVAGALVAQRSVALGVWIAAALSGVMIVSAWRLEARTR